MCTCRRCAAGPDDIPLLTEHFLARSAESLGKKKPTAPVALQSLLAGYAFPGNVRELQAMVFDAVSHHRRKMLSLERFKMHMGYLDVESPSGQPADATETKAEDVRPFQPVSPLPTLREAPRLLIREALKRCADDKAAAARLLGITRSGLNKALKRYES